MGLAGFDFEALNRRWVATNQLPDNDAWPYGTSVLLADGDLIWRCIGVYHLTPSENRGRRNIYVDVLGGDGRRIDGAVVNWRWASDGPVKFKTLDKPRNEPGCDIDIDVNGMYSLWVSMDGLPSDKVSGIHSRHADERGPNGEIWNSVGHHSFYVCFQRVSAATITPPIDPPIITPPTGNSAALAQLAVVEAELAKLRRLLQ